MFIPYSIVNPLTKIRIPRLLPSSGEVLVRKGDFVEPTQIVAQAVSPPDFRIVEVAQDLDISAQKALGHLNVARGEPVSEGDVLATRGGLGARVCRSPITGRVVGIGRGRLLLEAEPEIYRLNALVPGYVAEARPEEGVVIELVGGLIQALWGNGQEAYGPLRLLVRERQHPIRPTHINASSQGAILIGGSTVDEATLGQAEEMQVRGIIVGSIPPSLLGRAREAKLALIATEGVGSTPMCSAVFELLRSVDGREAALSGDVGDRWYPKRPFIVVPMPTRVAPSVDIDAPLKVGDRVRILRGPDRGRFGTISQMLEGLIQMETGARLRGAEVALDQDEFARVPYANLERLL
ncbi:MAG: KOW motif-containing protein [Anaerolineae bacterium]